MKKIYRRIIYKLLDFGTKCNSKIKLFIYFFHPDIHISKGVFLGKYVSLSCIWGGKILIGKNTQIKYGANIITYGGDIIIGDNCTINPYCLIYGQGGTKIGDNVLIAGQTMIIPQNYGFNNTDVIIRENETTQKGISIEDNVWIGHGCTILDGVSIARGSVIGAGSVVNRSTTKNSVWAGVPAKLIKTI